MDAIVLEPYDPAWPQKFEVEKRFVAGCFTRPPGAIEHIGSTSVPGLAAKPIIDITVLVEDLADGLTAVPALEAGGYSYWRDNPDKTRLFLVKGLPPAAPDRTHHLHIHANPVELDRHLAFRDALRADTGLRQAYADGQACPPLRAGLPEHDVRAAYAVQEINTRQWLEQGRRLCGRG